MITDITDITDSLVLMMAEQGCFAVFFGLF